MMGLLPQPFFTQLPLSQVTLPLEGCPSCPRASITLQLSADPWVYQPETLMMGLLGTHRTPGPRTLVVQVLEGEGRRMTLVFNTVTPGAAGKGGAG